MIASKEKPTLYPTIGAVLVTLSAFLALTLLMSRDLNMFDEGIILVDALRVMNGDVVHRDFYSSYGPAQYYLVAGLFKVFGVDFMVGRLYAVAIQSAIVGFFFYILAIRVNVLLALATTAICGVWMLSFEQYLYPIYPCIIFSLIGSSLMLSAHAAEFHKSRLVASGACTGLIALFRYDTGFFVMLAHLSALALVFATSRRGERWIRKYSTKCIAYCTGIALVFLPFVVAYLAVAPLGDFIADLDYARKYYPEMRGLPFPDVESMLASPRESSVYLPILAALLILGALAFEMRTERPPSPTAEARSHEALANRAFLIVYGLLCLGLFFKGIVRVSALHMLMGIIPSLIVFAALISQWWSSRGIIRAAAVLTAIAVITPAAHAGLGQLNRIRYDWNSSVAAWFLGREGSTSAETSTSVCAPLAGLSAARIAKDYLRIARYLHRNTDPDDRLFVGLATHDKIFVNSVGLYFVASRLPGTHWHQFDPGLQTRADVQFKIISELRQNSIKWIVRDGSFIVFKEPNGSAKSSGVKVLDSYLDRNYRPVAASGAVSIWLANDEPAPTDTGGASECTADAYRAADPPVLKNAVAQ